MPSPELSSNLTRHREQGELISDSEQLALFDSPPTVYDLTGQIDEYATYGYLID